MAGTSCCCPIHLHGRHIISSEQAATKQRPGRQIDQIEEMIHPRLTAILCLCPRKARTCTKAYRSPTIWKKTGGANVHHDRRIEVENNTYSTWRRNLPLTTPFSSPQRCSGGRSPRCLIFAGEEEQIQAKCL